MKLKRFPVLMIKKGQGTVSKATALAGNGRERCVAGYGCDLEEKGVWRD